MDKVKSLVYDVKEKVEKDLQDAMLETELTLQEELEEIAEEEEPKIDEDQEKFDKMEKVAQLEIKKINQLVGHSELLNVLQRSKSNSNLARKTGILGLGNILNSTSRKTLRGRVLKNRNFKANQLMK